MMSSHAARLVAEDTFRIDTRTEVRCTARRHRAVVSGSEAAVVLGVLGYPGNQPGSRVPATELLARARAWQSVHDPHVVGDPDSADPIDWTPDPDAVDQYLESPSAFRRVFSAFTLTARPPREDDWISWRSR
jgi:hypothetical protein